MTAEEAVRDVVAFLDARIAAESCGGLYPGEHPTFRAERCADVVHLEAFAAAPDAITREGAALGLLALRDRVNAELERLANDPSPGVRATAGEA